MENKIREKYTVKHIEDKDTEVWFDIKNPANMAFRKREEGLQPLEEFTMEKPLNAPFQLFDKQINKWVIDQSKINKIEAAKIKEEIACSDYRIIKFIREKFSDEIEKLYPGETEQYQNRIKKLKELNI